MFWLNGHHQLAMALHIYREGRYCPCASQDLYKIMLDYKSCLELVKITLVPNRVLRVFLVYIVLKTYPPDVPVWETVAILFSYHLDADNFGHQQAEWFICEEYCSKTNSSKIVFNLRLEITQHQVVTKNLSDKASHIINVCSSELN
jgi:hypothetical protein